MTTASGLRLGPCTGCRLQPSIFLPRLGVLRWLVTRDGDRDLLVVGWEGGLGGGEGWSGLLGERGLERGRGGVDLLALAVVDWRELGEGVCLTSLLGADEEDE